jgi:hypothetical protein
MDLFKESFLLARFCVFAFLRAHVVNLQMDASMHAKLQWQCGTHNTKTKTASGDGPLKTHLVFLVPMGKCFEQM